MNTMQRTNPYMIDAQALGHYKEEAQFFVSVIRKRLERSESDERERVLIVLSAPRMRFRKAQDLRPIQATPQPGSRVFLYIRKLSSANFFRRVVATVPGGAAPARRS